MLELNVVYAGETDKGSKLAAGDKVEYCGHLPGGNVKIRFTDGRHEIAHPMCFNELR